MKKNLQKFILIAFTSLCGLSAFSQNQTYWNEGFEPSATPACDLVTVSPTVSGGNYFNGNAGVWYGNNVYRTTGTGCPSGNNHVRYKNISGVTDSGYLVTPIVSAGINEFHMKRARASRSFTLWVTNDTLATTTNWTPVVLMRSSALTVVCNDTTVIINSATAKRLKIVGRPGTDSDVDSIWITSVGVITPVKFGNIAANQANNLVKLNWNIETETNTNSYIIERSANSDIYKQVGSLNANKAASYTWMDNTPSLGLNYYRIVALDNNGTKQYSSIVKINLGKSKAELNVYPNPVKGGQLNVAITGINKGSYTANIYNTAGALVYTTSVVSESTSLSKTITLPSIVKTGNYSLEIVGGGYKKVTSILVQ